MRAGFAVLLFVLLAGISSAQQPPQAGSFVERFPRDWCGPFRWDSGGGDQQVTLFFSRVQLRADGKVEAQGPGIVRSWRTVHFRMRAVIDPETRAIEMFESVEPGTLGYVTDGSHVGRLDEDLRSMRLVWTTRGSGEKGSMELMARPPEASLTQPCGPPSS